MRAMFFKSKFNGDIAGWDVSNVTDMKNMFLDSPLEKNPPIWYNK
jgi:surface protein